MGVTTHLLVLIYRLRHPVSPPVNLDLEERLDAVDKRLERVASQYRAAERKR